MLPTLHMSLGIFKKLYDMLEESCHRIDVQLFQLCVSHFDSSDPAENNFDQLAMQQCKTEEKMKADKAKKEAELDQIEEELPLHLLQKEHQQVDGVFQELAYRAFELRRQIQGLVSDVSL